MKITDIPAAELLEKLRATERAKDPDRYALSVLRSEMERRLNKAEPHRAPQSQKLAQQTEVSA